MHVYFFKIEGPKARKGEDNSWSGGEVVTIYAMAFG